MSGFDEAIRVLRFANAEFFASALFHDSFRIPFPVPRDNCGMPFPTPPENWRQYVAFYRRNDECIEPVGFCNWIRYGDVYLEGGMCVKRNFYRRLPREHWNECRARGGIAQIMMETAARELDDCVGWFGYCGDRKAHVVDMRVGYQPTRYQYLIVKWFAELPDDRKRELEDRIATIGPF